VKNPNFSLKKVQEIVNSKAAWIYDKLKNIDKKINIKEVYENENKILYLGSKENLYVKNLENFYREKTKEIVSKEIQIISAKMSMFPAKVSFRKTKNRWGSCNHKNELNFTITLAQLPVECIRYIIIHELSHIPHKNHKREFYDTIKTFMPNFKAQEKILKDYSPSL